MKPSNEPRSPSGWVAVVVVVLLLPMLAGLVLAVSPDGRDALASWWARPSGWRILTHSMLFAAVGAGVGLLAGWAVALLLPASGPLRKGFLAVCCLPLLVPCSLMGVGWIMAMGRDAVLTNVLRRAFGESVPTIYDLPIAAAATGLRYFGVAALVLSAARREGATSRAAQRVFGLSWWMRLRLRIGATRLPAMIGWLLLFLLVQSDHILPGMFLVHTFGTEVLIQFNALMEPAGAAALALIPTLIALIVILACGAILRRGERWSVTAAAAPPDCGPRVPDLRGLLLVTMIVLIAVGVPLTGLIVRADNWGNLADAWRDAAPEVRHSIWLAVAGAATTLVLAVPLAHGWVAAHRQGRASGAPLVLLNLTVPGSLLALGVMFLPAPRALVNTDGALVAAYAARFAAVAMIVLFADWIRQPPTADVAARVHGVSWIDRLLRITLPARAPATVAAFALVALLVVAELEISLILVRPGPTTLGVRLYTLIHTAPDHVVAALAVDVLIAVLGVAVGFVAVTRIVRRFPGRRIA